MPRRARLSGRLLMPVLLEPSLELVPIRQIHIRLPFLGSRSYGNGSKHAVLLPPLSNNSGLSVRQRSMTREQRPAKAQPGGGLEGEGISPSSFLGLRRLSRVGMESSNARV